MPHKWKSSKFRGVRFYEHPTRKHGFQKDRYLSIRFQKDGVRREEGIAWTSERDPADGKHWTEAKAALVLEQLKKAAHMGEGPSSLAEKRLLERKRKEAERAEEARRQKENITFKQFFEDTYYPISKTSKKESSYAHEETHFRLWINPIIGKKPIKVIAPTDIERIKKKLLDAGRTLRTIQYVLATIRQIWNMARRSGLVSADSPTRIVKIQKFDNRRQRFLSHEEAGLLLGNLKLKDLNTYRMSLLSLSTGMRAGEVFGLTWGCVDTERGIIKILDAKSGRGRTVYITDEIRLMFKGLKRGNSADIVFVDRQGKAYKEIPALFRDVVRNLNLNSGISDSRQKITYHSLRHTFASWHAEAGTDLYIIKALLGHSTITQTERYAHLGQNTLQTAVSTFQKSLQAKLQQEHAMREANDG